MFFIKKRMISLGSIEHKGFKINSHFIAPEEMYVYFLYCMLQFVIIIVHCEQSLIFLCKVTARVAHQMHGNAEQRSSLFAIALAEIKTGRTIRRSVFVMAITISTKSIELCNTCRNFQNNVLHFIIEKLSQFYTNIALSNNCPNL